MQIRIILIYAHTIPCPSAIVKSRTEIFLKKRDNATRCRYHGGRRCMGWNCTARISDIFDLVVVGGGCTGLIAAVRQGKPVWEVGGKDVEALL